MNKTIHKTLTALFILTLAIAPLSSHAAEFNPGMIISDYEFTDVDSMNYKDIENFLRKKGSTLVDYVDPYIKVGAVQLIHDNAQLNGVNPKVLLVLLQKEQSLITDRSPSDGQYDAATGYGYCDGDCRKGDPKLQRFVGFANQIDYAASALRLFYDKPQTYGYNVGTTHEIDGEMVTIQNAATHAFYIYTPHIHGNKNFHKIWHDWFSQDYPDGTLLQDAETGGIYLLQNGAKRPFASMLAFASRFDLGKVITTSPEILAAYPDGPAIKYAQYSLLRSPRGTVYLLADDKKRGITSQEVFRKIGFNPEEVMDVAQEDLDLIPEGIPLTLRDAYPTGILMQETDTGGVWFVRDNVRHAIWSRELMDTNYPALSPVPTNPVNIALYPVGNPVIFNDGELVKAHDHPEVFVISNGMKRPILSGEDFEALGYHWDNIISTTAKALSLHPLGDSLSVNRD